MQEQKRTPLFNEHIKLKGRIVPFAGWEMPVQYAGVIQEHEAVRTRVGVFDVSHMGEFFISGPKATEYLNRMTTNDVTKLENGSCQYTLLCHENGTVVDDLILSRISQDEYLAVVNAANVKKDFDWLVSANRETLQTGSKQGVTLKDRSDEFALIAVQGPNALSLVNDLFKSDFTDLVYYHFAKHHFLSTEIFVMRTGYTGEDGFEIMIPAGKAISLWQDIFSCGQKFGVQPAGLGARDTLRLEAAYSLYGHEISDQINPLEANLGWVIKIQKGDFIGRPAMVAIKEQGLKRKIVGMELIESGIAREQCRVFAENADIGYVTSGTHSPTLKKSIALALIASEHATVGTEVIVDIRGKRKKARVIKTPFYQRKK